MASPTTETTGTVNPAPPKRDFRQESLTASSACSDKRCASMGNWMGMQHRGFRWEDLTC